MCLFMRNRNTKTNYIGNLFEVFSQRSKKIIQELGYDIEQFNFEIYPMSVSMKNGSPIPIKIGQKLLQELKFFNTEMIIF